MDDHIHIPLFLSNIVTMCFFLLNTLPQSHSQQHDNNYTLCSRPFNCGAVSNIYYPFWGDNRPEYCGSSVEFKLHCEDNQYTSIEIGSQDFQVLEIDNTTYTMRMVRKDLVNDVCHPKFIDTNLSSRLFQYTETMHKITIFYGCIPGTSIGGNAHICSDKDKYPIAFYEDVNENLSQEFPGLHDCKYRIQVPALQSVHLDPDGGIEALKQALNVGFEVKFHSPHAEECKTCRDSKGACGTNDTASYQFSCHCPDGYDASSECSAHIPIYTSDDEYPIAFYEDVNETLFEQFPGLHDCKYRIQVPALQSVHLDPGGGIEALKQALSVGFEVKFTIPSKGKQWNIQRKVIIGVTSAAIAGLLICITICCCRSKSSTWQDKFWLKTQSNQDIEAFLKSHGALTLKRYKFSDVRKMTNSLKVKLGQGGFGAVYKGKLLTGDPVAIKMLNASKGNGEEFINEVASISRTSHVNVVTLLGFCLEGSKKALIYEFMPNGSLEKFIYKKEPETTASLSWEKLYQIAIGIARGLEYLHRGCNTRILHFDIKPHNILLDENFCPKISDFGLAKLCPKKESIISMSDARGTIGYVAPEMWSRNFGGVSHKSDVYSYGMMLLEMVGATKNINAEASHTSEIYFPHWLYNRLEQGSDLGLDGVVDAEENEVAKRMIVVGLWCIQTFPKDRPTISRVIEMLEGSMNSLEMPPKPVMSSPIRSVAESSTTSN